MASKVALISGGARGKGAANARLIARENARVAIGEILEQFGTRLAVAIRIGGGDADCARLDMTSAADRRAAVTVAKSAFGRLDVLINNAGIWRGGRVEETSVELWDAVNDVNSKGVFLGTRAAMPAMQWRWFDHDRFLKPRDGGSHLRTAHPAAGWAVRTFSKLTATQYAGDGIRANSLKSGPFETDLLRQVSGPQQRSLHAPGTPCHPRGHSLCSA